MVLAATRPCQRCRPGPAVSRLSGPDAPLAGPGRRAGLRRELGPPSAAAGSRAAARDHL